MQLSAPYLPTYWQEPSVLHFAAAADELMGRTPWHGLQRRLQASFTPIPDVVEINSDLRVMNGRFLLFPMSALCTLSISKVQTTRLKRRFHSLRRHERHCYQNKRFVLPEKGG